MGAIPRWPSRQPLLKSVQPEGTMISHQPETDALEARSLQRSPSIKFKGSS